MIGQQPTRHATLIQPLVIYIEPQLLLLRSEKERLVLALAVPHGELEHAFFSAEIREGVASRYFDGKADLNYAMRNAAYDKYYMFDLSEFRDTNVEMKTFPRETAEREGYFPDPGAFARSHTVPYNVRRFEGIGIKRYTIDGSGALFPVKAKRNQFVF